MYFLEAVILECDVSLLLYRISVSSYTGQIWRFDLKEDSLYFNPAFVTVDFVVAIIDVLPELIVAYFADVEGDGSRLKFSGYVLEAEKDFQRFNIEEKRRESPKLSEEHWQVLSTVLWLATYKD
jgi:hypothetical protein